MIIGRAHSCYSEEMLGRNTSIIERRNPAGGSSLTDPTLILSGNALARYLKYRTSAQIMHSDEITQSDTSIIVVETAMIQGKVRF